MDSRALRYQLLDRCARSPIARDTHLDDTEHAGGRHAGQRRTRGVVTAAASTLPFVLTSVVAVAAFLYPLLLPALASGAVDADVGRAATAPLIFVVVAILCVVVLLTELGERQSPQVSAGKMAALLGAVVAVDATLRLVPSLGGASPVFLLIILAGAVFGARTGFLVGSMTILLSALLTGGIGPWLPYQMIGAGWVGLGAGWLPPLTSKRCYIVVLALYGVISALAYGALLNLYAWPFAAPGLEGVSGLFWEPQLGFAETLARYASFYLVTSLGHDLARAAGNAILILALGEPLLRSLERASRRLSWRPAEAS